MLFAEAFRMHCWPSERGLEFTSSQALVHKESPAPDCSSEIILFSRLAVLALSASSNSTNNLWSHPWKCDVNLRHTHKFSIKGRFWGTSFWHWYCSAPNASSHSNVELGHFHAPARNCPAAANISYPAAPPVVIPRWQRRAWECATGAKAIKASHHWDGSSFWARHPPSLSGRSWIVTLAPVSWEVDALQPLLMVNLQSIHIALQTNHAKSCRIYLRVHAPKGNPVKSPKPRFVGPKLILCRAPKTPRELRYPTWPISRSTCKPPLKSRCESIRGQVIEVSASGTCALEFCPKISENSNLKILKILKVSKFSGF